ncbi:[protein-PII] uridylyltransferase [Aestuariibacter salexigens]|uniref:[protein-PII] uridylyltransferase n=1 Tax=Aestuariibacter salexigens TaxID=226010 RepID=UPI000428DCE1|nr:[protein-PII] uridylyltransferase [Aestuariibacter salexigens]
MSLHSLLGQIKRINSIDNTAAFRECVDNSYAWLRADFDGMEVDTLVTGRAAFIDALVRHAWKLLQLDQVKDLALVAVGGYGRGQLQPYSDIDLLILSRRRINDDVTAKISQFITLLWDSRLDVGQSVRTIKETIKLAKEDITIATNLVEARYLAGCHDTLAELNERTHSPRFWSSKDFFVAKLEEQRARHAKFHDTSYNLEPNVKENPGCLRDIQSIGWVAKKHFNVFDGKLLVGHGYFTESEYNELIECRSALWRLRFALHMTAGRSENRLLFDYQTDVAEMLGYGSEGKASVERMMKSFFRIVRRVRELNDMLLQRFQADILSLKVKQSVQINQDFMLNDGLISPSHDNVFAQPESILQFLLLVTETPDARGLDTDCLRQLRNARREFQHQYFCERMECRQLFMQLMKQPAFFGLGWDIMHKHGILQAYLPEWDHIVGMMQFDLFHAYTVDEHTHRLVKHVYHYFSKDNTEFPRSGRIVRNLDKPELLFLAAIFHDIAKGRNGDHSKLGAKDVANFAQRHDLSKEDASLVQWLVEHHLLMSVVAQRRDIYDPEVIADFATKVRSHNHLNHLYALTLADIRATNDNLWNEWKASLLRELYLMTQKALDNGLQCEFTLQERVDQHKAEARAVLLENGTDEARLNTFWQRMDNDYFARFKPQQLVWHANVILDADVRDQELLVVDLNPGISKSGTELIIYGRDRHALFAQVASVLDSRNCSIHDAQIMSTTDGFAFDTFVILEHDGERITSPSRLKSLKQAIVSQLEKPGRSHTNQRKMSRQMKQLDVKTKVRFYGSHQDVTLVELEALDAPGMLAKIGHLFVDLNISLKMAKISTIGERAEDLFIITNEQDTALDQNQLVELRKRLIQLLDQSEPQDEACQN